MLSILIPTKDYKIGLQRIIKNISEKNSKIKIIISDDSTNNEIEKYIKKLNFSNISYSRNAKTLGLAGNFNKLLKQCKSRYLMFIHHDDYINDRYFFYKLFRLIKNNKYPDIISIDTEVENLGTKKKSWHINYFLRYFLNLISKKYILKRNYFGPLSSLIIKNINLPLFDNKLKWLVDVDFYYRVLLGRKIIFTDILNIKSEANHKYSATFKMRKHIKKIHKQEYKYLREKYKFSFFNNFFFIFDKFFWILIRTLNLFFKK